MRTPWRDALDGKIRVMRDLHTELSVAQIREYFSNSRWLRQMSTGESKKTAERTVEQYAIRFAESLSKAIQRAEPFWVSQEVFGEMANRIKRKDYMEKILFSPCRASDLPVEDGVVWFPRSMDTGVGAHEKCVGHEPDPQHALDNFFIQAIYFGRSGGVLTTEPDGSVVLTRNSQAMSVVSFLDVSRWPQLGSDLPDYRRIWGGPGVPKLLPWMSNGVMEGAILKEWIADTRRNTTDASGVPFQSEDIALSVWPVLFCKIFFELLQERQLRYGGSGVEREARKEARRHGVEPTVQVVEWRKAEYRYPAGYEPKFVAWTCRWPSREHLRHLKSGKVVRVAASIKGPKDKPLKLGRERVNVVKF